MAKAITYVEIGKRGGLHATYYSAVDADIDTAWAAIMAAGSFTLDGATVHVRGARRWDTPRMRGNVCLGNVGGATFDAQYGNMETQSGSIFSDSLNLFTSAFSVVQGENLDVAVNDTSEPAEAQVTFTVPTLPLGGVLTIGEFLWQAAVSLLNSSGATRTVHGKAYLNDVLIGSEQSFAVDNTHGGYIYALNEEAAAAAGDTIAFKIWVDAGSVTLKGQSFILVPNKIAYHNGDLALLEQADADPGVTGHEVLNNGITLGLTDPASGAAMPSLTPVTLIRPGQYVQGPTGGGYDVFGDSMYGTTLGIYTVNTTQHVRIWTYR